MVVYGKRMLLFLNLKLKLFFVSASDVLFTQEMVNNSRINIWW